MRIEYAVPSPENATRVAQGKGEILHVGLRYELAVDGKDEIHEVLCRKPKFLSLGPATAPFTAKQLTYAQECEKWHHKRDAAVRAKWDMDDKAQADATVAAAKAAEEAKFIVVPQGFKDGNVVVSITHHGMSTTAEVAKGADATEFEANCRAVFATHESKANAEKSALASFALVK